MIKKKNFILSIIFILIVSLFIKLKFSETFYSETDDLIAVHQILNYKQLSIYDIANEKISPTYNSNAKKIIRSIQTKDNFLYDYLEKIISKVYKNTAPSKTSTFAPLQYLLFADLINLDQNYKELKFNSRLPSILFSMFYIVLTLIFCNLLFGKNNKYSLLTLLILIFSFPLIYISLRSYNYAAGTLSATTIFLLTYLQLLNKKFLFNVSREKIDFRDNLFLGVFFSLLAYLNYSTFFLLPLFFLVGFFSNLSLKDIFSKSLSYRNIFSVIFITYNNTHFYT